MEKNCPFSQELISSLLLCSIESVSTTGAITGSALHVH